MKWPGAMLVLLTLPGCRMLDSNYDGSMALAIGPDGFAQFTAEPWDDGSTVHSLDRIGAAIESGATVRLWDGCHGDRGPVTDRPGRSSGLGRARVSDHAVECRS